MHNSPPGPSILTAMPAAPKQQNVHVFFLSLSLSSKSSTCATPTCASLNQLGVVLCQRANSSFYLVVSIHICKLQGSAEKIITLVPDRNHHMEDEQKQKHFLRLTQMHQDLSMVIPLCSFSCKSTGEWRPYQHGTGNQGSI